MQKREKTEIKLFHYTDNSSHIRQIRNLLRQEKSHMLVLEEQEIERILKENQGVLALFNNITVGFAKFFENGKKDNTPVLEVGSLVVHPGYRKKGIAKKMINELLSTAKHTYKKALLVAVIRKTNINSYRYFKNLGAREIAKPQGFGLYPPGWGVDKFHFFSLNNIKS